jgi:hypothetical protein
MLPWSYYKQRMPGNGLCWEPHLGSDGTKIAQKDVRGQDSLCSLAKMSTSPQEMTHSPHVQVSLSWSGQPFLIMDLLSGWPLPGHPGHLLPSPDLGSRITCAGDTSISTWVSDGVLNLIWLKQRTFYLPHPPENLLFPFPSLHQQ